MYELTNVDLVFRWKPELAVQILCALGFGLTPAIGEEDEWDVVFVKVSQALSCARNGL